MQAAVFPRMKRPDATECNALVARLWASKGLCQQSRTILSLFGGLACISPNNEQRRIPSSLYDDTWETMSTRIATATNIILLASSED